MPTLAAITRKKAQRFLPLTFKTASPQKVIDLGGMVDWPAGYFPANPSIVKLAAGFLICVRGVNYILENARTMKPRFTNEDSFRTLNKFFVMSSDFTTIHPLPQLDEAFADIEDVRLFAFNGELYGMGSRIVDAETKSCCITLGKIAPDCLDTSFRDIPSPFGLRQEKNWSPFIHGGDLYFLYSYHPLVIVKYRSDTGEVEFCNADHASYQPQSFPFLVCGSSPGFETPSGYLFVAHRRTVRLPSLHRAYLSRLYRLDRNLSDVTGGPYFVIERPAIQFVNGLLMDERSVYITYGNDDSSAHLARFDKDEYRRLLPDKRAGQKAKGRVTFVEQPESA